MQIKMTYELTADDYCEFQRAYLKHRKALTPRNQRGFRSPNAVLWIAVVIIMALMFAIPWDWFSPPPPPVAVPAPGVPAPPPQALHDLLLTLVPYFIMFALVWGFILWMRKSKLFYGRLAMQLMRVGDQRVTEITDTHLTIREPRALTQAEWGHYIRFIETPSLFLLFITPRMAHILPKRGFRSTEAMAEFRDFAHAHVGNEPGGFPVLPATPTGPFP